MGERHDPAPGEVGTAGVDTELLHRLRGLAAERHGVRRARAAGDDTAEGDGLTEGELTALARLLGAVAATRPKADPAGEEVALAAFRAARARHTARTGWVGPRGRRAWRADRWRAGRRGRVAAVGLAMATLVGGGVAVAAGVPFLPGWGGGTADRPTPSASASPRPDATEPGTPRPGPSGPRLPEPGEDEGPGGRRPDEASARLARLCRDHLRQPPQRRREALRAERFAPLLEAAGSAARVTGYCRTAHPSQRTEPPGHPAPSDGAPGRGNAHPGQGNSNGNPGRGNRSGNGDPGQGHGNGNGNPGQGHGNGNAAPGGPDGHGNPGGSSGNPGPGNANANPGQATPDRNGNPGGSRADVPGQASPGPSVDRARVTGLNPAARPAR